MVVNIQQDANMQWMIVYNNKAFHFRALYFYINTNITCKCSKWINKCF